MDIPMRASARIPKGFTLEEPVLRYVERTKGKESASERVNQLLKRAIEQEKYCQLEEEAAAFFAGSSKAEGRESRAWQKASRRVVALD